MQRIVANSVVLGAIAVVMMIGAGQATAEQGLRLEPAGPAAPVGETGTGSATGLSKLLSSLSGPADCGLGGKPPTGSNFLC
ncbi:hypothetical protein [Nocardia sp. CS682]|uniref:hypothetical protein n=1 Tax=Nocardia sp. CS682 TaxID=1047172 RepID=UPI001075042C|nr:hypothetical protein [Nocardia sp. CS682]